MGDGAAEVELRGGFDAERAVAVVGAVDVLLEDGVFGERALEAERVDHVGDLAGQGVRRVAVDETDQLHGERGAAVGQARAGQVEPGGACDGREVDAGVAPEVLVLARDGRVEQHRRHLGEPDPGGAAAPAQRGLAQHAPLGVDQRQRGRVRRAQPLERIAPPEHCDRARELDGEHHADQRDEDAQAAAHFTFTSSVADAVRAWCSGRYISSTVAAGCRNWPALVARTR